MHALPRDTHLQRGQGQVIPAPHGVCILCSCYWWRWLSHLGHSTAVGGGAAGHVSRSATGATAAARGAITAVNDWSHCATYNTQ
jgi:hypothetical protein